MYAKVAVNVPLDKLFDYSVPSSLLPDLIPGKRVLVPFGRRKTVGYCVGLAETTDVPPSAIKGVINIMDDEPLLDDGMLQLTRWIAHKYICGWGEALEAALPAGVRHGTEEKVTKLYSLAVSAEEGLAQIKRAPAQVKIVEFLVDAGGAYSAIDLQELVPCTRGPIDGLAAKGILTVTLEGEGTDVVKVKPHDLTDEQRAALDEILRRMAEEKFATLLLQGITGSGKTEVYLCAIDDVVRRGKQAIVLVPEISLTPQTVERFNSRFDRVAVMHSRLTAGQRYHQWKLIRSGQADVVIGARSAIFVPTPNLGLVVMDEEHENSFKQDNAPRYHARDVALERARLENAVVVLGSATPSLESFTVADRELALTRRVGGGKLPPAAIMDMRDEEDIAKRQVLFSRKLVTLVKKALAEKNQTMIFLNRRGFSTFVRCPRCGFVLRCSHCDISLTYHKASSKALCHYCGRDVVPPSDCPECSFPGIKYLGYGTERIVEIAERTWPGAVIRRMDSDSMRKRTAMAELLSSFRKGEIDILVGTQMIAKGHDFPNVTVVGIVDADVALNFPDFRAAERTFQLVCQVSGRAGRSEKGGHVVIQTHNPDHYAIQFASNYDFDGFAEKELAARRELGYPPFGYLARILCSGADEKKVSSTATAVADLVRKREGVQVLGPAPAPISRVKGQSRWHVLVKAPDAQSVHDSVRAVNEKKFRQIRVVIDVDPVSLL